MRDALLSDVVLLAFPFLSMYLFLVRPFQGGVAGLRWESGNLRSLVHMTLSHPNLMSNHNDQIFFNVSSFSP